MALTASQVRRLRQADCVTNRIRAAREIAGLSQKELAESLGVTQSYLSDVERGRYESPALSTARSLAEFFGCSIEDLFPSKAVAS